MTPDPAPPADRDASHEQPATGSAPTQGRGERRGQPATGRQPGDGSAVPRRGPEAARAEARAPRWRGREAAEVGAPAAHEWVPGGARAAATAFAATTTTHLAALAATPHWFAHALALATKPLLMPLLAAWAAQRGAPRGLIAALLCGWAGDVLLEVGGTAAFMAGMGCFAAGHVCYLRLFAARGAFRGPRRALPARFTCYGLVWAVMIVLLAPGLDPGMRAPVAVYSLLLTAMAAGAYGLGPAVAAGGALFLLSDTLIAAGIADWPQPPGHEVAVMLTYAAAQALLAAGVRAAGPPPSPARATAEAAA